MGVDGCHICRLGSFGGREGLQDVREGLEDMIDWPRYTLGARTLDMYFADRSHPRTLMRRRGHFAAWGMWIFPLSYWLEAARQ